MSQSTASRRCRYVGCQKSLDHRRIDANYCSRLCYSRHANKLPALSEFLACPECNAKFRPVNLRTKFCSRKCSQQHASRRWRSNNSLYVRQAQHVRRAQVRNHPDNVKVSDRDWRRLVNRYSHCCAYCGEYCSNLHMDHVVPLMKGGRTGIGNTLPACLKCNISKHALLLVEWRSGSKNRGRRRVVGKFTDSTPSVVVDRVPCLLCGKTPLVMVKGCCRSCYVYKLHHPEYEKDPSTRICPACHTEIDPSRPRDATYCNKQCHHWAVKHPGELMPDPHRPCEQCNQWFTASRLDMKYCSAKCKGQACNGTPNVTVRVCPDCGKLFKVTDARQRYCHKHRRVPT